MKYKARDEFVASLREMADFIEQHGIEIPQLTHPSATFTAYLSETDYVKDEETGEWNSVLKEDETKSNLRRFLSAVGSCEKKWDDGNIRVTKKFGRFLKLEGVVRREVACKKVPTGEKRIIPSHYMPERIEEEYEWECTDVSLINLTNTLDATTA